MPEVTTKLTGKQPQVLAALISGKTIEAAAKSCSVSPATIHHWLKEPDFSDEYRAAKREVVAQAVTGLQAATGDAVKALREIVKDSNEKGSTRVAAARTIIEMAARGIELDDLAGRIEALEAAHTQQTSNGNRWY